MELDKEATEHEINFWRGFVRTERFAGWIADKPTPELCQPVQALLSVLVAQLTANHLDNGQEFANVLDVGSGPVSILRGLHPCLIPVTCDPLSKLYQEIFDYDGHGIDPPLPYAAEDIPDAYHNAFEVVHISNALDHTASVQLSLDVLTECVVPGGFLIVQGFVDEARHENYQGFHQHNLACPAGQLLLNGEPLRTALTVVWSQQTVLPALGRDWFVWVAQKEIPF